MVAIEYRSTNEPTSSSISAHRPATTASVTAEASTTQHNQFSANNNLNANDFLSPTLSTDSSSSSATTTTTSSAQQPPHQLQPILQRSVRSKMSESTTSGEENSRKTRFIGGDDIAPNNNLITVSKSAVSQRQVDIKMDPAATNSADSTKQELAKRMLKLDLSGKEVDEYSIKSPRSPIAARLQHQTSLTSSVDVEDRKTLRDALYQGIFHRHRRTIFAVGSFLRMLRSRNSQYNSIRSSSEGDGDDIDELRGDGHRLHPITSVGAQHPTNIARSGADLKLTKLITKEDEQSSAPTTHNAILLAEEHADNFKHFGQMEESTQRIDTKCAQQKHFFKVSGDENANKRRSMDCKVRAKSPKPIYEERKKENKKKIRSSHNKHDNALSCSSGRTARSATSSTSTSSSSDSSSSDSSDNSSSSLGLKESSRQSSQDANAPTDKTSSVNYAIAADTPIASKMETKSHISRRDRRIDQDDKEADGKVALASKWDSPEYRRRQQARTRQRERSRIRERRDRSHNRGNDHREYDRHRGNGYDHKNRNFKPRDDRKKSRDRERGDDQPRYRNDKYHKKEPNEEKRDCRNQERKQRSRSRSHLHGDRNRRDDSVQFSNHRRNRRRSNEDEKKAYEWGKEMGEEKLQSQTEGMPPAAKEKPNFGLSGALAEDTNKVNGVVVKYSEPPEARKPKRRWRLYPFKGETALPVLHIHRQSCFLVGRDRKVVDLAVDHPSCSKQHAAMQYRLVPFEREDGTIGKRVRLYLIDLESANGTFLNNQKVDTRKYYELIEKDVVKFGFSSREYVLLHENSKEDQEDDDIDSKDEPDEKAVVVKAES